jgi:hypothetical protein
MKAQITAENSDFMDIEKNRILLGIFEYNMLRLGQILTKNESERYGISLKQLARYMVRNRKLLHNQSLTAKQIRSNLYGRECEIRGGGVCAEWQTESECVGRKQAEYKFRFSRILRPEDYLMPTNYENRQRNQAVV